MILTRLRRLFTPGRRPLTLPHIDPADNLKVSAEERARLKAWLDLPDTKLALRLLEGQRPRYFVHLVGAPQVDSANESRRLHLLQGWELYRATVLSLHHTPQEVKAALIETYPDEPDHA